MTTDYWADFQRKLMTGEGDGVEPEEYLETDAQRETVNANAIRHLWDKETVDAASMVDVSFFPLARELDDEPLDKTALEARTKIDLLKSYLEDVSKIEVSLRSEAFLANQAHFINLSWIMSELNGSLLSWGAGLSKVPDSEDIHHVAARMRIQGIVEFIRGKMKEIK